MLNTAKTLKTFFSSFDLPAYTVNNVPENTQLPYITYQLVEPEWDQQANLYCQVWWRKNDLAAMLGKADAILAAIGTMKKFKQDGGYVVLYPATPLIQTLTDEDTDRAYINLIIRTYHMPGV